MMRLWTLAYALVVAVILCAPSPAAARWVHDFTCDNCHKANANIDSQTTNLCVVCHATGNNTTYSLRSGGTSDSAGGKFDTGDASDAMGNAEGVVKETSHFWAATSDNQPAAGAQAPANAAFYGRYGYSNGKVTCSRCHDVHADKTLNPQLLRTGAGTADAMCLDCHRSWNKPATLHGLETHPMVADYASVASGNPKYNSAIIHGDLALINGGVSCSTCHGAHYADSDANTTDGVANQAGLSDGDGKLLHGDGKLNDDSALCQACHKYKTHGSGEIVGCLDCHSGHSYNNGSVNYFVLRENTTTATFGDKSGLRYTTVPGDWGTGSWNPANQWGGTDPGTADGYCETCHGVLTNTAIGGVSEVRVHVEGEDCNVCHNHFIDSVDYTASFQPTGCDQCHGFPPTVDVASGPNGYALDVGNGYDYSSSTPPYKNESATPHGSHSGPTSGYNYACGMCHNDDFATTHDIGTFQDVFTGGTFQGIVDGGGALAPNYATGGAGTCSNVGCHSNGNSANLTPASIPGWDGGKDTIVGLADQNARCEFCHGNDATSMATSNNTAAHAKHLNKGYSCKVCHVDTASTDQALAAGAQLGDHADGDPDVDFDPANTLLGTPDAFNTVGDQCSNVYCHSNGRGTGYQTVSWASTIVDCKSCHNHNVASGSPMASDAHTAHINDLDSEVGRNIGCATCHADTVSDDTTISAASNHVDGLKTVKISIDNSGCSNIKCHSNGNFDVGAINYSFNNPAWATGSLSGCDDCHGDGAGKAYPTYGNGGTADVDANSHDKHILAGATCNDCHSLTSTDGTAIDGTAGSNHVNQVVDVAGAQIGGWDNGTKTCSTVACHGGNSPVWGATGLSCADCHMSAAADTDDFAWNGTAASIDSDEWTFSGHGNSTTYEVTGRSGAALDTAASGPAASACFYCHDSGIDHNQTNYLRLRDNGFADLNGNCLACHGTTGGGVDPDGGAGDYAPKSASVKVDKYHGGETHTGAGTTGGRWCWDCHDPHGDASAGGQRIQMVQRNASPDSDANGLPTAGLTGTDIIFTDNTLGAGAGGFAMTSGNFGQGVCNNCHTATENDDTSARYRNDSHTASHPEGKCTICHEHSKNSTYDDEAFKGSGCNGCHGNSVSGQYWPDGADGIPAYVDDQAGAHDKHVEAISQAINGFGTAALLADPSTDILQKEICAFCHDVDPGGGDHTFETGVADRVDVFQDVGAGDYFKEYAPAGWTDDVDPSDQAYNYVNASCSNLACHNRINTSNAGGDWNAPPATPDCSLCHTGAGSSTGHHGTHVTTEGYACTECHVNNGTYPGGTTGLGHADGLVGMAYNNAGSFEAVNGDGAITYDGTLFYGDGNFGTCASAACHYNVPSPAFNAAPAGAPNCGVCHGIPTSAKHSEHNANVLIGTDDCSDCHGASADTGDHANHIDGTLDNSVSYVSGDQTCTTSCHVVTSGDWLPGGSLVCTDCHNATNMGPEPSSGLHISSAALTHGELLDAAKCNACHDATPTDTHITGGAAEDETQTNYTFNATNIFDYSNAAGCAANCHSDAAINLVNPGKGKWYRKWIGVTDAKPGAGSNPGDAVCDNCHNDAINDITKAVDNVWNGGLTPGHGDVDLNNGIEMLGQHGQCKTCHGWDGAGTDYNETWGVDHGDGTISMNGPDAVPGPAAGAQYDETTRGCLMACHQDAANVNHQMAESGWSLAYGDFGSGDCDTCHTAEGATHGSTNEHPDMHNAHAQSGYSGGCTDCHSHDGISVAPDGLADHFNGVVNFTDAGKLGATASTDLNYNLSGGNFNTNCTNSCHDSDGIAEWASADLDTIGGDSCNDCHASAGSLGVAVGGVMPPTSNNHGTHLDNDAMFAPATDCDKCHGAGAKNGAHGGHVLNDGIDLGGEITSGTTSCANNCHDLNGLDGAGGIDASWTTAENLGCADCHNKAANAISAPVHAGLDASTGPAGDKHASHTGADTDYVANCATCHTHSGALSLGSNGHVDGVQKTLDGSITVAGDMSCTNSCHITADGRDWTVGTLFCTDCHTRTTLTLGAGGDGSMSGTVAPDTNAHTVHMNNSNYAGDCIDCHSHSGSLGAAGHVNGPTKASIELDGAITPPLAADDSCTNSCHTTADGRDWVVGTLLCADCHGGGGSLAPLGTTWPPSSNAHGEHFGSNAMPLATQNDCYACHADTATSGGVANGASHMNLTSGDLVFDAGFRYENAADITTGGTDAASRTCSAVVCHNGATTPRWDKSVAIACGDCHGSGGPLPVGSTAGNHDLHANNDGSYTDCDKCHGTVQGVYTVSGGANHQNLQVEIVPSTGTYSEATAGVANLTGAGVNWGGDNTDNGTCSNVDCHYLADTSAWGTPASAYPDRCDNCHSDGVTDGDDNTLAGAVPPGTDGIHKRHVTDGLTAYVDDCNACHDANASTGAHVGHADGSTSYGTKLAGYSAGSCTTNQCHDDAAGNLWVDAATLTCNDCHNATGKDLYVTGALTAGTAPATGKHGKHMAKVGTLSVLATGCLSCHPHGGDFAAATHADGGSSDLVTNVDLGGSISGPAETLAAWTNTCTNSCHSATAGDEWTTGTLECSDCHSGTFVGGDYASSGQHSAHTQTAPTSYTDAAANNSSGAVYDFTCATCHGTTIGNHMDGTKTVDAGVNFTGGDTCSNNACHHDGQAGDAAVVASWTTGWVADGTTDTCDNCHGNAPASGAHSVHSIGIHTKTTYGGASGLLAEGDVEPSAHGGRMTDAVTPTSTVINCQVCHFNTVTGWNNDQKADCAGCHNGTTAALRGNMTVAETSFHVNGVKEVAFTGGLVRTKAQIRNNIEDAAELGNNWKRMNDGLLDILFYKGTNGYDESEQTVSAQAQANWNSNSTCLVACHNGIEVSWGAPSGDCSVCHTELP